MAYLIKEVSTIEYLSNLQPIDPKKKVDTEFLSFIHDPFALEEMNKLIRQCRLDYNMTDIQKKEMSHASIHCVFAFEDDYPWGTVYINNEKKVVCKCINYNCKYIENCRKGLSAFKDDELRDIPVDIKTDKKEDFECYKERGNKFKESLKERIVSELKDEKINIVDKEVVEEGSREEAAALSITLNKEKNVDEVVVTEEISEVSSKEKFEKFEEISQEYIIQSDSSNRIVVNAGPGTGKTWTLIEKLIYMVSTSGVDPEEIIVLCFSRAAVDVIETRLKEAYDDGKIGLNWHVIDIRTFDSFASYLLTWVAENYKELLHNNFQIGLLDYDARIKEATDVLQKDTSLIEQCSHLIVDEVQDLVSVRAKFVMQIIRSLEDESGYTLFGDACQSIYDYQIQAGEIDSTKFYSWIFDTQVNSEFLKLTVNHRQVSYLEALGNLYRNAILTGDEEQRIGAVSKIYENIGEINDVSLTDISFEDLNKLREHGKLGILTRTNAQALKISTWFRNSEIPHKIQKQLSDYSLNVWIAEIFCHYENETIDKETFISITENYLHGYKNNADDLWNALIKSQYYYKDRYYVNEILEAIINNPKSKELYAIAKNEEITISNIHRSKGREFDKVILLNKNLLVEETKEIDLREHKVSYVALTRAKSNIYRVNMKQQYISIYKNRDKRAYRYNNWHKGKSANLSHIEFGRKNDINKISFAESIETQNLIKPDIIGERVILKKNKEVSVNVGYICYDIFLEDRIAEGILGRTSITFYDDLNNILKKVKGLYNCEVYEYLFPERFKDIYVDDVVSIIGKREDKAIAAKQYSNIMVWKGITFTGFAQVERDRY